MAAAAAKDECSIVVVAAAFTGAGLHEVFGTWVGAFSVRGGKSSPGVLSSSLPE